MRKDLRIEGVKHAVAVASGKGGVGKSTTAGIILSFFVYMSYTEKGFNLAVVLGILAFWACKD